MKRRHKRLDLQLHTKIGINACRTVEINGGIYRCKYSKRLLAIDAHGNAVAVHAEWLRQYLDHFTRFVKRGKKVRCPHWVAKFVLNQWRNLRIPVLDVFAPRQAQVKQPTLIEFARRANAPSSSVVH